MNPRRTVLGLLLAGTLAATAWVASRDEEDAMDAGIELTESGSAKDRAGAPGSVSRPASGSTPAATGPGAATRPGVRFAKARRDLFPAQTWYIPPPPPKPLPPPPPMAPPLPYGFLGQWREDGNQTLFLTAGARQLTARAGDVLDGAWKLEAIRGTQALFVYLPLNQTRTLSLGESL